MIMSCMLVWSNPVWPSPSWVDFLTIKASTLRFQSSYNKRHPLCGSGSDLAIRCRLKPSFTWCHLVVYCMNCIAYRAADLQNVGFDFQPAGQEEGWEHSRERGMKVLLNLWGGGYAFSLQMVGSTQWRAKSNSGATLPLDAGDIQQFSNRPNQKTLFWSISPLYMPHYLLPERPQMRHQMRNYAHSPSSSLPQEPFVAASTRTRINHKWQRN